VAGQELPPHRARPTRRRIDARTAQDLPDGRRRNCHAELDELGVDPLVSPQRVLPRQADDKAGDARACRRAYGPAALARVVLLFPAASLRCQASSVAGVTGKTSAQRPRGTSRHSAANQARSADSYRTRPTCRRSTAFSWRSASNLRWHLRSGHALDSVPRQRGIRGTVAPGTRLRDMRYLCLPRRSRKGGRLGRPSGPHGRSGRRWGRRRASTASNHEHGQGATDHDQG
jgi:hypothetical protein